ncbi:NAD(P)H-dependent oxidoreductase [Flavobacteriaceae bacterium TK19130]|nr:NAD(P)H-dependent oxidoreductase [Thermobacterium salinum]
MKEILAFAGSNSKNSINHKLVETAISKLEKSSSELIRLTDYELPLFGVDLETANGYPQILHTLLEKIRKADGLIISVNEHNGGPSVFYKNTMDWLSRLEYKFLEGKKILLMSTSTGRRGALSSFQYSESVLPRYGGTITASFRLPSFNDNFDEEKSEITDTELRNDFEKAILQFENSL